MNAAMVDRLAACGIPETLLHGDFHSANVMHNAGRLRIVDWTDGCVSHPFFDLATYVREEDGGRPALIDAYIDAWSDAGPRDGLKDALGLSEPLACLHHAVSYERILDAIEPGWRHEIGGATQRWLRRFLALTQG